MAADRDDDLARTATAPVGSSTPAPVPIAPIGGTLGRYRLERELGSGGMGVVHAAFDPDLERRVALKVLRNEGSSDEARRRLLNEARAMARLAHPNVVTVHEVNSANGRDYVAMEIVEGQTLAEWMRTERRPEAEIVDAFVAAGRGLAAAHAAGIVHRDFKPHNVLRHRNGRIVVTDFGLARDSEEPTAPADPLAETTELKPAAVGTSTPITGDTMAGSVLGTPAYMAPEQWRGGAMTPATDQFAFCVALWEALAGERPFKGATVEALREEVLRGPSSLDASRIPRRLRRVLVRGLDPEPARRWPSMEALLAAMVRSGRRRGLPLVIASAAVFSTVTVYVVGHLGGDEPVAVPGCPEPSLALDTVWPDDAVAKITVAGQRPAAEFLAADVAAWRAARVTACAIDPTKRDVHVTCLDGVLVRIDAVARALTTLPGEHHIDVGAWLVDPAVCTREPPPHLTATATPQMRATIAGLLAEESLPGEPAPETAQALVGKGQGDPCASVYARFLLIATSAPEARERYVAEAAEEAERCSDDRVRAEISLMGAKLALESAALGTSITSKLKLAEVAAKRVPQADVQGALDGLRAEIARRADQLDEAISRGQSATDLFAKRGRVAAEIGMAIRVLELRQLRAKLEDLAAVRPGLDALRARAVAKLGPDHQVLRDLDRELADWQFRNGDADGAVAKFATLYEREPNHPARRVTGRVLDAAGKPVAGATVIAGKRLAGSATSLVVVPSGTTRFVTTAADGTFDIPDATEYGVIVAGHGDLRARPAVLADAVTLRLEPMATIRGRVDLRGEASQSVTVIAVDPDLPDVRYGWPAPVARDGGFEIGGVPWKRMRVFTVLNSNTSRTGVAADVNVHGPLVEGVAIDVSSSQRIVHVVVRSTVGVPVLNAAVLVMPGKVASTSAREMRRSMSGINERAARQIEGEKAPPAVVQVARPGDLYATMKGVPEGTASACAAALPPDLADPQLAKKIDANLDKVMIECVPIPEKAEVVVIDVPPFPRLD